MSDWSLQQALETYQISHWGNGYFGINAAGHVEVRPGRRARTGIDLFELASRLYAEGLPFPVLVRFNDILDDRVDELCDAFGTAMAADAYRGRYTAVYPIKVNQQRSVVERILAHGNGRVGLEAGSKPELMAVLALSSGEESVIICNGYKDREYIRLALIGQQLGHRVHIVVEKLSELDRIVREARDLGVRPHIGLRVRLASIGAGKWQNTGGEKSKFGLSAVHMLQAVERLREAGMLDCLQLLHCHLGSQISNIRDIQRGMRECARYYAELRRLGADVRTVDVGGGLGVDYEGTRSRSFCSINYSLHAYAHTVVHTLWDICAESDLPHPDVITESGRAMTAHHAVLITNVIDIETPPDGPVPAPPAEDDPLILRDLWEGLQNEAVRPAMEVYHDAVHWLAEAQAMYVHGVLTLAQRARAERLYYATCRRVLPQLQTQARAHRDLWDELGDKLADKYFCNFSVFQSMPDVWAIDQIFPIVPLHRLDEAPTRRGILQDLTCDSDGQVNLYVGRDGVESTLALHPYRAGEEYLIGVFMLGAYQEILGDRHNLFGDTHSVNVEWTEDGGYRLSDPLAGENVEHVLGSVHIRASDLLAAYRRQVAAAPLSDAQRTAYLDELSAGVSGYTYLED